MNIILIEHCFGNLCIDYQIHSRMVQEIQEHYDGKDLIFVADPENSSVYIELDDNPDDESIKSFTQLQSINIRTVSNTLAELLYLTEHKTDLLCNTDVFYTYLELLNKYKCEKAKKELRDKAKSLFALEELMILARLRGLI